jgi:hypothetical protein
MWRFNVPGKNCLLEKTCWVTVGGRNLPGGSSETTPTTIHPPTGSGRAVSVERRSKWADAGTRGSSLLGLRPNFYL